MQTPGQESGKDKDKIVNNGLQDRLMSDWSVNYQVFGQVCAIVRKLNLHLPGASGS
jgi:hypothetical protein